jgi:hypothetical protein
MSCTYREDFELFGFFVVQPPDHMWQADFRGSFLRAV